MLRISPAISIACLACIFAAGSADARARYALKTLVLHLPYFDAPQPVAITDEGVSVGSITALGFGVGYSGIGGNITTYNYCTGPEPQMTISGTSPYSLGEFLAGECDSAFGYLYDVATNTFTQLNEPVAYAGESFVVGVSAGGILVGYYPDHNNFNVEHGFYFENGSYLTFDPPGSVDTYPLGINLGNTVFGYYYTGISTESGFLLDEFGDYTILNVPDALTTQVTGLNGGNQAVGYSVASLNAPSAAFFWQNNKFTALPLSTTGSQATAINEHGIVAGNFTDSGNVSHGFVWNPGTVSVIEVYAPVTGESLYITGINNANQITGYYYAVTKGGHSKTIGFTGTCKGTSCF